MLLINRTCEDGGFTHKSTQRFFYIFSAIPSAVLYIDLKRRFERRPAEPGTVKFLSVAGACAFGAYLFENICRAGMLPVYGVLSFLPPLPRNIIYILLSEAAALSVTWIIRLIPGVKKFI